MASKHIKRLQKMSTDQAFNYITTRDLPRSVINFVRNTFPELNAIITSKGHVVGVGESSWHYYPENT